MKNRIFPVSRKEFIEIRRDPRTLIMVMALPVMNLLLYSYAINFDIRDIKTVVYDLDNSRYSRELIRDFAGSGYFNIRYIDGYSDIEKELDNGRAKLALCIPANFSSKLLRNETAPLQAIVDGSDANTATVTIGYVNQIVQQYSMKVALATLKAVGLQIERRLPPIETQPRIWYNPELKSVNFMVPGLIATILMVLGTISTSLSMVGERERGTFEKLIVTPVRPYELAIGKMLPYITLSFVNVMFCVMMGRFWFKVPIMGSVPLLFCLSVIYLFSALGLGLMISAIAKTQRVAVILSLLTSLLPTFLLSGFVFPIESMPRALQLITYLVPARYSLDILRGIFLKGVGLRVLWMDVMWLLIYNLVMILASSAKFRKKLES